MSATLLRSARIYLVILIAALTACDAEIAHQTTVDTHPVVKPVVKQAHFSHEYVAEIHAAHYVELRSRIKAHIEKIHVDEGQAVKEGQLLFSLSFREFEKELQKADAVQKSAQADLKAAEVELGNVKRLLEKNIVAAGELELARAKAEALKAKVDEAAANKEQVALNLSFAQIKAPFSGYVNRIPNKVGSLVADGDILTSVSDSREVFAYFNLSEIDYLDYVASHDKQAETVALKLANHANYPHAGKIEMIESEFDHATGNIAFRARFPNPDGLLKHGSNGKVVINKHLDQALLIPQKSTFEIQDKLYVYVVKTDGMLQQRQLQVKMRFPDFYAIESGLSPDDSIVYEGAESMKEGDKIQPLAVEIAETMPSETVD